MFCNFPIFSIIIIFLYFPRVRVGQFWSPDAKVPWRSMEDVSSPKWAKPGKTFGAESVQSIGHGWSLRQARALLHRWVLLKKKLVFDNVWYISRNSFATLGYLVNSRITFHRKVIVFLVCSCCLALVKILAGFARVSLSASSKQSSHHCYNFACLTTFQKAFAATVSKRGCKKLPSGNLT